MGNDVLNILKEINSLKKGQVQIQMGKVQELDKKELANMRLEAWNTSNKWPISRALEILNTI